MLRRDFIPAIALTMLSLVLIGCGSARSTTPTGAPATTRLRIANYAFHPKTLTVRAGTEVTVANNDSTSHTATAKTGAFDTGTLKPGKSISFTLRKPGIYRYYCQFHAFMTGTIKVVR